MHIHKYTKSVHYSVNESLSGFRHYTLASNCRYYFFLLFISIFNFFFEMSVSYVILISTGKEEAFISPSLVLDRKEQKKKGRRFPWL